MPSPRVELLVWEGCPSHPRALAELRAAVAAAGHDPAAIDVRDVPDQAAAERERFPGSPTIRVDGRDVEPGAQQRTDFGLKCRLYATPEGLRGQPPDALVRAALAR